MTSRTAHLVTIAMTIALLVSCGGKGDKASTTDECGDLKGTESEIYNGIDHPTAVSLTEAQMKSIGALNLDWSGSCTATLVTPTVVLTAAHCVENLTPGSTVHFLVGENYMPPEAMLPAHEWHMHPDFTPTSGGMGYPQYDIAVIILDEDATTQGLEPIPANLIHTMIAGETIQAVGYGMTTPSGGWNSNRWWTTMPVVLESSLYFTVDGQGVTGICSGDSGGPMLYDIPGRGVHVMGVVSGGEAGCTGYTFYPRTDAYVDFLSTYIDIGPCGWETFEGRCDGDTAIWCEDDEVLYHDCASFGQVCGTDGDGNNRCVEPPPPCGDETFAGRCDGETAVWCEDDEVLYHDCASFGWYCGMDGEGNHRCIDDPCKGETFAGRCDGETAIWCEDGAVLYHDCTSFEYECGRNAEGNYRCNPPGSVSECDRLGHAGECVDEDGHQIARWCEDGEIRSRDCTVCDQDCGWSGDLLGYYCL